MQQKVIGECIPGSLNKLLPVVQPPHQLQPEGRALVFGRLAGLGLLIGLLLFRLLSSNAAAVPSTTRRRPPLPPRLAWNYSAPGASLSPP